jgi:rod shape-determining protein MreC
MWIQKFTLVELLAMWQVIERLKKLVLVSLLSTIPLGLLYIQSKDKGMRILVSKPIIEMAGVIEKGVLLISGWAFDALFRYTYMATRTEELRALRALVLETKSLRARVDDLMKERALILGLHFNRVELGISKAELARVVARAGAPMARMIRVDRGSLHKIKFGSPVISHGGVVGQVISVAPHFSDILLITDASSALDAKIIETQARGLLRGITSQTEYLMEIRDIDGIIMAKNGDVVVTSGINSYFPPGIPIGKVIESSRSRDGLYISARVEPLVNMDAIDYVLLLSYEQEDTTRTEAFKAAWPVAIQ